MKWSTAASLYLQTTWWCANPAKLNYSWKSLDLTGDVAAVARASGAMCVTECAQITLTPHETTKPCFPDRWTSKLNHSRVFLLRTLPAVNCRRPLGLTQGIHSLLSYPRNRYRRSCLREMHGWCNTISFRTVGSLGYHKGQCTWNTFQAIRLQRRIINITDLHSLLNSLYDVKLIQVSGVPFKNHHSPRPLNLNPHSQG